MLRILRTGQRWLTAIVIAGIGTVFVVFLGLQGGPSQYSPKAGQVVKVGSYVFGIPEFERVRERREAAIQEQLGNQYDARAMRDTVDNFAARELVESALLALAADDLGIHVSNHEIERIALADPSFRDEDGKFDHKKFVDVTEYYYHGQKAYMAEHRLALLAVKMYSLLQSQPEVSEGEAREAARRGLEEVKIAFTAIDPSLGEAPPIAPEAVKAAIASRSEEIAKIYQEKGELYNRPERVHARHILLTLAPDAPTAEVERVRGQILAAKKRIEAGEPFEDVAQELSQDPGSKERGGDLDFFARGQMVKEFEDAAFALTPGQISDPVKSSFGFHLIRVDERQDALTRPLESVREEIATDLLRGEAQRTSARERAEQLAAAIREGRTLEDAAREHAVNIGRTGWLTRGNGFVPGLGTSPELLATAFVLAPGKSSPRVFEVGNVFALVQVVERKEAEPAAVDALIEKKRAELLEAKRNERIGAWIEARRDALVKSGDLVLHLEAVRG